MKCGSLKNKVRSICFNSEEELILLEDMSENDRYNAIIDHYKRQKSCEPDLLDGVTTLEGAIKVATSQDPEKKKYSHQYKIPHACLALFCNNLLLIKSDVCSVKNFSDLHKVVSRCKVRGIGKLCIYDTADRIGAFLGIRPDKIYLHAGTKDGAEKLLGRKLRCDCISKKDLPDAFQREDLSCAEIEDILCRYKKYF